MVGVDASYKFFADLAGVRDPEEKRKIIGRDFVEVFNAEAKKITDAKWLAQGTIYPDRIESLSITGMVIKSHHNVGGLPKEMHLKLCEPLQWLFKDEVRRVGLEMGMPQRLIKRHPFPGPGHLPYDFMAKVSNEIINKVKGVNRVCYDISSKPPSTIEWE